MATTSTCGKRRRITERNSNPDICGMFRSETMSSGILVFSCKRASKPSSAVETSYPLFVSNRATVVRILGSSSTTRMRCFELLDISHPHYNYRTAAANRVSHLQSCESVKFWTFRNVHVAGPFGSLVMKNNIQKRTVNSYGTV